MLDPELVELSSDGGKTELRIIPNTHGPISESDIHSLLIFPEFSDFFPLQKNIDKAVKEVNTLCGKEEGKFELFFTLSERRDGEIHIEISPDGMQAEMTVTAAWGGTEITLPCMLKALKGENIAMGLSKIRIETLLKQIPQLKPGEQVTAIIATGKPATNGQNAHIERKVSLARERLLQPQEREDGTVDMRNLGSVIMVKPNDVLMIKSPATEGSAGYTVKGEVLAAKPGKDLPLEAGNGTHLDPKNPLVLLASVAGQPVQTRTGMQVDDVLQIKDVDIGYGHVDFKGSVMVTGDVHEGMIVKSSGDITVMGFVDSATLDAQGDITVSKGIIGRLIKDHELSTKLSAKGQISAQFVQYSDLNSQADVLITKQLLHSQVNTQGRLIVSDNLGRRGDLVGGSVNADKGITAVVIGATAGTKTEIFCGMNQGELKQELKQLDDSVKALVVAGLDIDARLKKLPPKSEWQADAAMVEQVRMMLDEKHRIAAERVKEEAEFENLKIEVDNYYQRYQIEALKHVFVNVELHIGPAFNRTQREHGPCNIFNINQEINFDYSNKAKAAKT